LKFGLHADSPKNTRRENIFLHYRPIFPFITTSSDTENTTATDNTAIVIATKEPPPANLLWVVAKEMFWIVRAGANPIN